MSIRDASELLRVLRGWKDAGLEFSQYSHPAVVANSEAHSLLLRLLRQQEQPSAPQSRKPDLLPPAAAESLQRFQRAFGQHGQSAVVLLAHPPTDLAGTRARMDLRQAGKPVHHVGMGVIQLGDDQEYACALSLLEDAPGAPGQEFLGLARQAGAALLEVPSLTFTRVTDPEALWVTFLFRS